MSKIGSIWDLSRRLICGLLIGFCGGQSLAADRLLIDDFSIDQAGFVTTQVAAFDLLTDVRLFGGGREIWGGGDFNCPGCSITAFVQNGLFQIDKSPLSYAGGAAISWPSVFNTSAIDLSGYSVIQIDVDAIVGDVNVRVTIDDAMIPAGKSVVGSVLSSVGLHSFVIPPGVDISSVRRITISSSVGGGEDIALSSIWLDTPEPTPEYLALIAASLATIAFPSRAMRSASELSATVR